MKVFPRNGFGFFVTLMIASLGTGLPGMASDQLEQQLDIQPNNRTQGQARDVADQLLRLGQQEVDSDNFQAGIAAWYRAIDIYITLGDFPSAGLAYNYIGDVYTNLGRYTEAEDVIRRGLAIAQDHADFQGQVYGFNNLGTILVQRGHLRQAQEAFQLALIIAEDIEDFAGMGLSLSNLGLLARIEGNLINARNYYETAMNYRLQAGDLVGQANSSNNLGQLYHQLGEETKAASAFMLARIAAIEAGNVPALLTALDGLIDVSSDRNDLGQVRRYLDERIAITENEGANPAQQLGTLVQLGAYYEQLGDFSSAQSAYQQALVLSQQLRDITTEAFVLNRLGSIGLQRSTDR